MDIVGLTTPRGSSSHALKWCAAIGDQRPLLIGYIHMKGANCHNSKRYVGAHLPDVGTVTVLRQSQDGRGARADPAWESFN